MFPLFADFVNLYIYLITVTLTFFTVTFISVTWSVLFRQNLSPFCHTLGHNTLSIVTLFIIGFKLLSGKQLSR